MAVKSKKKAVKKSPKKTPKTTLKKGAKKATSKATKMAAKSKPKAVARAKMPKPAAPAVKSRPSPPIDWDSLILPLEDRLIVQPEAAREKTAGGLFIPGTTVARPSRGRILAKGRGRRNKKGQLRPLDVKVGDEVLYADWAGTSTEIAGKEVLILREEEILGIVD